MKKHNAPPYLHLNLCGSGDELEEEFAAGRDGRHHGLLRRLQHFRGFLQALVQLRQRVHCKATCTGGVSQQLAHSCCSIYIGIILYRSDDQTLTVDVTSQVHLHFAQ